MVFVYVFALQRSTNAKMAPITVLKTLAQNNVRDEVVFYLHNEMSSANKQLRSEKPFRLSAANITQKQVQGRVPTIGLL